MADERFKANDCSDAFFLSHLSKVFCLVGRSVARPFDINVLASFK
jgi:hypothetical protein